MTAIFEMSPLSPSPGMRERAETGHGQLSRCGEALWHEGRANANDLARDFEDTAAARRVVEVERVDLVGDPPRHLEAVGAAGDAGTYLAGSGAPADAGRGSSSTPISSQRSSLTGRPISRNRSATISSARRPRATAPDRRRNLALADESVEIHGDLERTGARSAAPASMRTWSGPTSSTRTWEKSATTSGCRYCAGSWTS